MLVNNNYTTYSISLVDFRWIIKIIKPHHCIIILYNDNPLRIKEFLHYFTAAGGLLYFKFHDNY